MKDNSHIQRMLAKQYDFDVKQVLVRARELSAFNNWVLVQGILLIFATAFVLGFIFISVFGINTPEDVAALTNTQNAVASLLINVVLAPLFAGVAMLAINSARGFKVQAVHTFNYISFILPLGVATLLISIGVDIGMILLVVPAFYIFMATTFTLPLIVDKQLSPISAIILSVRMTNAYLFQMSTLFLIFFALFVGVILTFGFALIWVGPYFFNVRAVLYNELFCSKHEESESKTEDSGVFDA
jgi:hypothetical protein